MINLNLKSAAEAEQPNTKLLSPPQCILIKLDLTIDMAEKTYTSYKRHLTKNKH